MKLSTLTSLILAVLICFALRLDAQQVMYSNRNIPISERLNTDGSLKTDDGFTGSLDPTGYEMSYDAKTNAPKFFAKGNPPKAQVITWSALGSPTNGVNFDVYAIAVSGSNVYVGGQFTQAGGSSANYIAKWNGSSWSALGSGMDGTVYALAVSGTDVYAGGNFTTAGSNPANRIAK